MDKKKCVLILPYFGKFNNYFELFLKSCKYNPNIEWLIFSDCNEKYEYPLNVRLIKFTLQDIHNIANKKFEFQVCMKSAYKLCDYKPAYGFLFEEYIKNYEYWGYCDCDLIFGNIEKFLNPLFEAEYDKIFAAGHLTLYRNTFENNRRFMLPYHGRYLYKEAFTMDKIYVFDEDMSEYNVHKIFIESNAKIYTKDLSMNSAPKYAYFRRAYYNSSLHTFSLEPKRKARYYWACGKIVSIEFDCSLKKTEYIYMHLQGRKMRLNRKVYQSDIYQILPDHFKAEKKLPSTKRELNLWTINFSYLYWIYVYVAKIKRKLNPRKYKRGELYKR